MDTNDNIKVYKQALVYKRIIFSAIFLLSFIISDAYNIIPLLSGYALYKLFGLYKSNDAIDIPIKPHRYNLEKVFLIFIVVLEIFFSYIFRFVFEEFFGFGSISFGEFNLIPTFIFWVELGAVLIYYYILRKEKIRFFNKKAVLFSTLLILPFLYSSILSALPYAIGDNKVIDLSYIDCINSSYRAFILAGFIEELFYRGLIYDGLKTHFSSLKANIIQAAFFSLIHSRQMVLLFQTGDINIIINFVCVFFLGIISAKMRDMTNSFLPSIIFHGCLNGCIYYLVVSFLVY